MDNFQDFYKKQKDKLFSYLMRITGDYYLSMDIMQESFLRCLDKYNDERMNAALLYTIARNVVFDYNRRTKRKKYLENDATDYQINQEEAFQINQEYRQVLMAMNDLETDEREILSLVLTENLRYREIASIMGINENNVKVKVHRARVKLKKFLQSGDLP